MMKLIRMSLAIIVGCVAIFAGMRPQPALAAETMASTGGIEIENRTNIWGQEGMTISRVEYLSYSMDDLNDANWKGMCGSPIVIGDTCIKQGLEAGNYIVRTLSNGEVIEVFTDVNVTAEHVTMLSAERVYRQESITIINQSPYDIELVLAQEGNYVSDPVSYAEKYLNHGSIGVNAWQEIYVNGDFEAHHIMIRDEVTGGWFYDVPAGGVIIWKGDHKGDVLDRSLYLSVVSGAPGGIYIEAYEQGNFVEIPWSDLYGVQRASIPYDKAIEFWNVVVVDVYCGGTSYAAAFCTVWLEDNSFGSPFEIDACNFNTACNGSPSMDVP